MGRHPRGAPGPGPSAVHGRYDLVVPIGQSGLLVGAERIFDDAGTHFDVLDPRHDLWRRTLDVLGLP